MEKARLFLTAIMLTIACLAVPSTPAGAATEFYDGYVRWVFVDQNGWMNVAFNYTSGEGTTLQRVCYASGSQIGMEWATGNYAAVSNSAPARQEILATLTAAKLAHRPVSVRVLQNSVPCSLWAVSLGGN